MKINYFFQIGQQIRIKNAANIEHSFYIEACSHDELLVSSHGYACASIKSLPPTNLVFAKSKILKGLKYTTGDKINLITRDGKKHEMFISYILDDSLVISPTRKPSFSSLKWILKMMDTFLD